MKLLPEVTVAVFCYKFNPSVVFSVSLLESVHEKVTITLNPNNPNLSMYDFNVGFSDISEYRLNGIPYTDFGLFWKKFGLNYCENDRTLFKFIEHEFVVSIDAYNSGIIFNSFDKSPLNPLSILFLIDIFSPSFVEGDINLEKNFDLVLDFSKVILERVKIYGTQIVSIHRARYGEV